jgi:hypothetical protein
MTAHEVLSPGFVDNIVKQDDGFRVLRNLRGSPPYWEKAKKGFCYDTTIRYFCDQNI